MNKQFRTASEIMSFAPNGIAKKTDFSIPTDLSGYSETVMKNYYERVNAGETPADVQANIEEQLAADLGISGDRLSKIELARVVLTNFPAFCVGSDGRADPQCTNLDPEKIQKANNNIQSYVDNLPT